MIPSWTQTFGLLEPDSWTSGCVMVDHVLMEPTDPRIVSYNCRGFNAFKVPFISELLNMCDILLLQETWLYSSPFCLFTTYIYNYNNVSICGMDESVIHAGRPYGGCTVLYKSSCTEIYPIYLGDLKRTCGIKWKLNNTGEFVHSFTVFLPCDDNIGMHHHVFNNVVVNYLFVLSII